MASTHVVTILFCDLVASTARRARLGDDRFDEFSQRFMEALRGAISEHNGREVSSAGDGLMVVFPVSAVDAVLCATAMHQRVALLDAEDPPRLRVGISTGEVAEDGENYSGMPIVEAARLEAQAAPGETYANAIVRAIVGSRRGLRFREVGSLTLKGIPAPLATVAVVDTGHSASPARPPPVGPRSAGSTRHKGRRLLAGALAIVVVAVTIVAIGAHRHDGEDGDSGSNVVAAGVPAPHYTVDYRPSTSCPPDVREVAPDARCGTLTVPENRTKPDGRTVKLLVSRAAARIPSNAPPSIDVCGCEDLGNSLTRNHASLIRLARRGYEGSEPQLNCREFAATREPAFAAPSNDPKLVARATNALRRCWDRLHAQGIDPGQYNVIAEAADILDLMHKLKIARADFTANGESDAVVFEILRRAPGAVRSVTLDNPAPPGTTHMSTPTTDLSGSFHRFAEQCQADPACDRANPDLPGAWSRAYAGLMEAPPTLEVANPLGDNLAKVSVLVDGPRAADALAAALNEPGSYRFVPGAITQPTSSIVAASALNGGDGLASDAPWAAQASYYCSYQVHTLDPDALALSARQFPSFVRSHDHDWTTWCHAWPVPDRSAELSLDVASPVPALLFRGDLAPDGNPTWIADVARGFDHAQIGTFPTRGGDLLSNGPPCLTRARADFLADPKRDVHLESCAEEPDPIDFGTG